MPHISVKIFPGRTEAAKRDFALAVRQAAVEYLGADSAHVTVAMEEIAPADWYEQVYRTEVLDNANLVFPPAYHLEPDELR